jgi:hypothetical protein
MLLLSLLVWHYGLRRTTSSPEEESQYIRKLSILFNYPTVSQSYFTYSEVGDPTSVWLSLTS